MFHVAGRVIDERRDGDETGTEINAAGLKRIWMIISCELRAALPDDEEETSTP